MEIQNPCSSMLSNFEVYESLQKFKATLKKKYDLRNLATISYEILQYLEETPCKSQSRESITSFLQEIKSFNFTKNECLMIINDPPTSAIHIQLLIEDSEERLTEEQVGQVLEIVAKHLIPPPEE